MRRSVRSVPVVRACGGLLVFLFCMCGAAIPQEASVLQADREFVQAAAKGDGAAVAELLDADFSWTDSEGKTLSRADALSSLPKPALGNEVGARQRRHFLEEADPGPSVAFGTRGRLAASSIPATQAAR